MKVRIVFTALVLVASINCGVFAQKLEKLTFEEIKPGSTTSRTVTVDAVFVCYLFQAISIEDGLQVIYESAFGKGKWTEWELTSKPPSMLPTIRQLYNFLQQTYSEKPKLGVKAYWDGGIQTVRIMSISTGSTSPITWDIDGKTINVYYKVYVIKP